MLWRFDIFLAERGFFWSTFFFVALWRRNSGQIYFDKHDPDPDETWDQRWIQNDILFRLTQMQRQMPPIIMSIFEYIPSRVAK